MPVIDNFAYSLMVTTIFSGARGLLGLGVSSSSPLPGPATSLGRLRRTSHGISELVGVREGAWLKKWEGTIRRAVIARQESQEPMYQPDGVQREIAGAFMDGFYD